jgi:hypothetical protein
VVGCVVGAGAVGGNGSKEIVHPANSAAAAARMAVGLGFMVGFCCKTGRTTKRRRHEEKRGEEELATELHRFTQMKRVRMGSTGETPMLLICVRGKFSLCLLRVFVPSW